MNRRHDLYECDFCGLSMYDLADELEDAFPEMLFEVSDNGKQMACAGCAIGRDGFKQWDFE